MQRCDKELFIRILNVIKPQIISQTTIHFCLKTLLKFWSYWLLYSYSYPKHQLIRFKRRREIRKMSHRTQVWVWKLRRDQEPSCYNWPKWIIILLYHTRSQGKLEVNFEISILEMSDLWLPKISLEEHARHHHYLTSELIMKFQFSISIIMILLTSYLRDLYILWTIYDIGFELRCILSLNLINLCNYILHALFLSNVTLFFWTYLTLLFRGEFAKHHWEVYQA